MAKWKKVRPKVRGKKEVYDEWEHCDIDRDEQMAGLKRRARRWKEIEMEQKRQQELEKKAIDKAGNLDRGTKGRPLTELEEAWLRCDFLLSKIMEKKAYEFMEWQRINDPETYKKLYRKFMSPNMMLNAQYYVDIFARYPDFKPPRIANIGEVIREYKKIKGIKTKFVIKYKGEDEKEL